MHAEPMSKAALNMIFLPCHLFAMPVTSLSSLQNDCEMVSSLRLNIDGSPPMRSAMRYLPLTLLLLAAQAHAQLVQFADTTASWYVADTYPNGSMQDPGFTETLTTAFSYDGDTLLGLDQWSVMQAAPLAGSGLPSTIGFARAAGDVVLFRDTLGVVDTLYDFSLLPGDSVFYPGSISAYVRVEQVSAIVVAGVSHRVIAFEPFLQQVPSFLYERWIEGVGSVHGPLYPRYPRNFMTEVPGDSLRLTCFKRNSVLLWSHPDYPDCVTNIIQGTDDLSGSDRGISMWPNPGAQELMVASERSTVFAVVLCDAQGRVVLQRTAPQGSNAIDTSALASGPYTVRVIARDGSIVTRSWIKH